MMARIASVVRTGCAGVLGALLLTGCEQPAASDSTDVKPVRPAQIEQARPAAPLSARVFPATIEASRHTDLAFRVSGQLVALPVNAGDQVKQGQLLAQLDETDFNTVLQDRQARYRLAKVKYEQIKALISKQYASQANLDEAQANLKAATAALDGARDNLRYTRLIAPYDGVVARVDVENFQAVTAQKPVLKLQDSAELDVVFNVPEILLTQIDPQVDARQICGVVVFDNQPDSRFNACYKKHDSVPDPLTRTYRVVFGMPETPRFSVLPGMSASVQLDLKPYLLAQNSQAAVMVPLEAVFEYQGQSHVWQVTDQHATRQPVTLFRLVGDQAVIGGIEPGTAVVSAGVAYIQDGQAVRAIQKERGL